MLVSICEACERNKGPLLQVLAPAFAQTHTVLEIGSGTGQHAVFLAAHLPAIIWQPTDTDEYLPGLRERIRLEAGSNVLAPLRLDVRDEPWPVGRMDGLFSANTLHIMSWSSVEAFFQGAGKVLADAGVLCVYGPFRYTNGYTSESNAEFDRYLRGRDPESGIRDFEAVTALARRHRLHLRADHPMPANNQTLVWQKVP